MAAVFFRICLFMLSNWGYWEFFRKKSNINVFYLPAITICIHFLFLFFGGLFNLLAPVAYMILGCGFVLLILSVYNNRWHIIKPYLNLGYGFFVIVLFVIALAVNDQLFAHYDSFSHWALVVKQMLNTNRFPNFTDTLITFQSYPLGSATYIYYFSKIVGQSESIQMLAQAYIMISMILPVFAFIKHNKLLCTIPVLLMSNLLLCYHVNIYNLLVDTLLPLTGMATLLFIGHQCMGKGSDKKVSIYYSIPFLCFTSQIKNSAIFFTIIAILCLLIYLRKMRTATYATLISCAAPFIIMLLWNRHCSYVFSSAATSKHAMTIQNFSSIFSGKSSDQILQIIKDVLEYTFSQPAFYILMCFMSALGILTFIFYRQQFKRYIKHSLLLTGLYLVYIIGIIAMYIFSMPQGEAASLAGISRYIHTIDIAVYYALIIYCLNLISSIEKKVLSRVLTGILTALIVGVCFTYFGSFKTIFDRPDLTQRTKLESVMNEYSAYGYPSYYICLPEEDAGYSVYLGRYLLQTPAVGTAIIQTSAQMDEAKNFSVVLILDEENTIIHSWVAQNYPEQSGASAIFIK